MSEKPTSKFYPALLAFCVSCATLLLQLTQTRIYAVVYWNHVVYFVITIALLGFGISGTWLSLSGGRGLLGKLTIPMAALGFVVTTLASAIVAPCLNSITLAYVFTSLPQLARLLAVYGLAVLPFFFSGWILGVTFRDYARHIHTLYFADLAGACVGCLLFLFAMQPLGAVALVALVCLLLAVPALAQQGLTRRAVGLEVAVVALAVGTMAAGPAITKAIQPEPTKAIISEFRHVDPDKHGVEFTEWNIISRIDVAYSETGFPFRKAIFCDGDSWTEMQVDAELPAPRYDFASDTPLTNRAPFYFKEKAGDVLVIGTGGGVDVYAALRGGAESVDAIDINPTTFRLMLEEYREETNDLMFQPGVKAFQEEGRSFVRRSSKDYDVIMLHGIDTFTAQSTGAYVLTESYLYTVEAIEDYLSHLDEDGILCITRVGYHPERSRLFAICLEALYRMGIPNPNEHIVFHSDGFLLCTILVRMTPFTESEITSFAAKVEQHGGVMHYPADLSKHDLEDQEIIDSYARSRADGTHKAYLDSLPVYIAPVYDDSPFFFLYDRPSTLLKVFTDRSAYRRHWPSFTLFALLAFTIVMVSVFMFLPLWGRRRASMPGFGGWLVYFLCLGVGFIFVEIVFMQRFALLLGHPSRSLSLVLASLLLFAGIGSYARGALRLRLARWLPVLVAGILVAAFAYPLAINAALGASLPVRAAVTILLIAPLGFLMGMPFPTGISRVSQASRDAVPWMWAVNGGATVLGSVLAIIVAIWGSFTAVLIIAAACYLLALVMFVTRPPESGSPIS